MSDYQILCFGDSNTWGYRPPSGERYPRCWRWPGVMGEQLGPRYDVIEEGQCGRTTVLDDPIEGGDRNGLRYLRPCLESHRPLDLVIVMLGTNDLKARFSLTALDIALGAECLVKVIRQSECSPAASAPRILLAAPPPVAPVGDFAEMFAGAQAKSHGLARRYAEVAERHACAFVDLAQIVAVDPADGIHYAASAHHQLGIALAEHVRQLLEPASELPTGTATTSPKPL